MIAIIDYEAGNLKSVYNAFEAIEHTPTVTSDPVELKKAAAIVLPGVGAFGEGVDPLLGDLPPVADSCLLADQAHLGRDGELGPAPRDVERGRRGRVLRERRAQGQVAVADQRVFFGLLGRRCPGHGTSDRLVEHPLERQRRRQQAGRQRLHHRHRHAARPAEEIGRASCRERV